MAGTIAGATEVNVANGANSNLALYNSFVNRVSTGLQNGGGLLSINADATKFDISDGVGLGLTG